LDEEVKMLGADSIRQYYSLDECVFSIHADYLTLLG